MTALQLLEKVLEENRLLNENMTAALTRNSDLVVKARAWRRRLMELGDPDPGIP